MEPPRRPAIILFYIIEFFFLFPVIILKACASRSDQALTDLLTWASYLVLSSGFFVYQVGAGLQGRPGDSRRHQARLPTPVEQAVVVLSLLLLWLQAAKGIPHPCTTALLPEGLVTPTTPPPRNGHRGRVSTMPSGNNTIQALAESAPRRGRAGTLSAAPVQARGDPESRRSERCTRALLYPPSRWPWEQGDWGNC